MIRRSLPLTIVLALVAVCYCCDSPICAEESPVEAGQSTGKSSARLRADAGVASRALDDGLYLVLRQGPWQKSMEFVGKNEQLVANDFHLLEPEEREPTVYMVLQKSPFVPLILGAPPKEDTEENSNKPRLQLQLSDQHVKTLEDFTREHMGQTVAIVIGGDVVTCHKVKSAITGGALQITRCTKHGCETLFTTLLKNRTKN